MRRERFLSAGLIAMVIMIMVTAQVFGAGGQAAPAQTGGVKEISWLTQAWSGYMADLDNPVLKAIEAATNVRVNVTETAVGDYTAKLNTLIASRQLPDLFTTGGATAMEFIEAGMLYQIENLLQSHGPNIRREMGDEIRRSPINNIDRHTYMITGYGDAYRQNLFVRLDWLRNVNLPMPTDLDSLYKVLYAFTFNDPDRNGRDDTIGFSANLAQTNHWTPIFGAFGIAYPLNALLSDGTVTTYMKHPNYLEAIRYIRRLYQDGILDPEFATMPAMTTHEKFWSGQVGVYGFQSPGPTNNWYPGRYTFPVPENPADLFGFTDIKGPYGDHGVPQIYKGITSGFVVSATTRNPDAVIQFLDFMCTEKGDELVYLGVEGLMYEWTDKANGKYRRLGEFANDAVHRANGGWLYWRAMIENNTELRTMNKATQDAQEFARNNVIEWPYLYTPLQADIDYGAILPGITVEAFARLIVTTGNLEAEYRDFVRRWENEGGLEWEREATRIYRSQQN